jgi:hypothetical protein
MSSITFNPNQLASYAEARSLREYLNSSPQFVGRNVLPGDDEKGLETVSTPDPNFPWLPPKVAQVGIYLPSWVAGPHGDPEPNQEDKLFLHFRFANGFEGANVGLFLDKFRRYPNSPLYVLSALASEILP